MGDRPASLNRKAVDRIGLIRRLYLKGSESAMTETISDLLMELEELAGQGAKAVSINGQYLYAGAERQHLLLETHRWQICERSCARGIAES
jgi:hypothetical protein